MIQLAAVDAFDVAVLFSGDQDLLPAVEAVAALGKQVWLATWGGRGLSPLLREACFGEMNLRLAVESFRTKRPRSRISRHIEVPARTLVTVQSDVVVALQDAATADPSALAPLRSEPGTADFVDQIRASVQKMPSCFTASKRPYASRWYFENRWKDAHLPQDPELRRTAVQRAIDAGVIEEYETRNDKGLRDIALRVSGPDAPDPATKA